MSKYVKNLITRELSDRFKELEGVAVINPRGINAIKTNQMRGRLHAKGLRMTVVKNTLARRAVPDGSKIKGFDRLLDGPSAVIYGNASMADVARFLLAEKKTDEKLEMRGIFYDGEAYVGDTGIEQVSKLPTREEAIGNLIGLLLSPGRNLAAVIKGPGGQLGAILKAIEEKRKAEPQPAEAPAAAAPVAEAPAAAPVAAPAVAEPASPAAAPPATPPSA